MIIVMNRDGQMCNQFLYEGHVIASAIKYKQNIVFLRVPTVIKKEFNMSSGSDIKIWCLDSKILNVYDKIRDKIITKLKRNNRLLDVEQIEQYNARMRGKMQKKKILIINNWLYRDYESFYEHEQVIRKIMSIKKSTYEVINYKFKQSFNDQKMCVAIHARRGDYREWKSGIYYYDDNVIIRWIRELKSMGEFQILIFSNEKLDKEKYMKEGCFCMEGDPIEDLIMMSMCDYILGPPSTFSYWAAFLGNKLYYRVKEVDDKIKIEKFALIGVNED